MNGALVVDLGLEVNTNDKIIELHYEKYSANCPII